MIVLDQFPLSTRSQPPPQAGEGWGGVALGLLRAATKEKGARLIIAPPRNGQALGPVPTVLPYYANPPRPEQPPSPVPPEVALLRAPDSSPLCAQIAAPPCGLANRPRRCR